MSGQEQISKKSVIIFGASTAGQAAHQNMQAQHQVIAFCDNDQKKVGTLLNGLPVLGINQLTEHDFAYVLVASEYFEQIQSQLEQELHIPSDKIQILPATKIKEFHFGDNVKSREVAEQLLIGLCNVLTLRDIKHHIDAGTLLGIVRDQALIPWDDDLDIAIPAESARLVKLHTQAILDALEAKTGVVWQCNELLANQEFGIVKKGVTRSFKLAPKVAKEGLPLIDLFVKYIQDEKMDYVISSRGFSMPSAHMNKLDQIEFKGAKLFIPSCAHEYLSLHYGDWQTPKPDWNLADIKSATVFQSQAS